MTSRMVAADFNAKQFPLGFRYGYKTNLGPVRKPSIAINGYILDERGDWVIAAQRPGGSRRRYAIMLGMGPRRWR